MGNISMQGSIIGHSEIISFFEQARANDALNHAYCFVGRSHIGKTTLARRIAADVLGCAPDKIHVTPDVLHITRESDEKTGKLKKDISVDQIRHAVQFFYESPFGRSGYKVLIIEDAELMSIAAANALLKTLEEPRGKRVIFLLTRNEKSLLPTILSRCQTIFFNTVAHADLMQYVLEQGCGEDRAQLLVRHADGLPGLCVSWMMDPELFEIYMTEVQRFTSLIGKPYYEKLQNIENLFNDPKDHINSRVKLQEVIHIWHANLISEEYKLPAKSIVQLHDAFLDAKQKLNQNVHPRLLLEHIMLQLP